MWKCNACRVFYASNRLPGVLRENVDTTLLLYVKVLIISEHSVQALFQNIRSLFLCEHCFGKLSYSIELIYILNAMLWEKQNVTEIFCGLCRQSWAAQHLCLTASHRKWETNIYTNQSSHSPSTRPEEFGSLPLLTLPLSTLPDKPQQNRHLPLSSAGMNIFG